MVKTLNNKASCIQPIDVMESAISGTKLWKELHTQSRPTQEWFSEWCERVPSFGCDCRTWLANYLKTNPPRYNDWFTWTWELHNAVNGRLPKATVSFETALRVWRPLPTQSDAIAGCKIVTAFGPKRLERQSHCLETWLRSGFEVHALQTKKEMPLMQETFGEQVKWIEENAVTTSYDFPTQRISRLLGEATEEPILLLNSDCAMTGGTFRFKEQLSSRTTHFYLRWNYDADDAIANEFEWGIDGVLVWPRLPAVVYAMPYGIGQPMWDYALPHLLLANNFDIKIDHYPWLCHENHQQNWTQKAWRFGSDWLCNFDKSVPKEYFQFKFRENLDPRRVYDAKQGMWIELGSTTGSKIECGVAESMR